MNSKRIQFNRQRLVSLLLAGLILALAASLTWLGADASLSQTEWRAGSESTDPAGYESELSPESPLRYIAAGKLGGASGGTE